MQWYTVFPSPSFSSDPTTTPTNLMSQAPPVIPPSSFQSTFSHALRAYKKRTRGDLILHPLAARLQSCDSPDAILAVLQEQAQAIEQSWNADEKLAMWLEPIVNVLYALSSSLGEGVGLVIIGTCSLSMYGLPSIFQVSSPAKVIFVGIGVILSVCTFLDTRARAILTLKSFRKPMPLVPIGMGLSTSSDAWPSSFGDSELTLWSRHLNLLRTRTKRSC